MVSFVSICYSIFGQFGSINPCKSSSNRKTNIISYLHGDPYVASNYTTAFLFIFYANHSVVIYQWYISIQRYPDCNRYYSNNSIHYSKFKFKKIRKVPQYNIPCTINNKNKFPFLRIIEEIPIISSIGEDQLFNEIKAYNYYLQIKYNISYFSIKKLILNHFILL